MKTHEHTGRSQTSQRVARGSMQRVVQRRRYINPDFLRDHAAKPLAIGSVEYVDGKCVVEVARMAGNGECWLPDKYSYEAHEIPEADVAQAWKPLNEKGQR
jgi:hypothetical protein